MNEFRVIKCKKCDAALTELEGEKLTQCVQCGYRFGFETTQSKRQISRQSNRQSRSSITTGRTNTTPELATLINKLRLFKTEKLSHDSLSREELPQQILSHETGTIHQSRVKAENKETPIIKSKKSTWTQVVKWYLIIVFSMGALSQCGKYI
ncbi:MAG: hypothetical protein L3J83_01400 [Proteobacteria bacterium]|nr:hypothetical protein [Pseudomonadota bacterium]